jgi:hypothetical protein
VFGFEPAMVGPTKAVEGTAIDHWETLIWMRPNIGPIEKSGSHRLGNDVSAWKTI